MPRHAILEKIFSGSSEDECCSGDHDMTNNQREMISIIQSAQEILGQGEIKVRLAVYTDWEEQQSIVVLVSSILFQIPVCTLCIHACTLVQYGTHILFDQQSIFSWHACSLPNGSEAPAVYKSNSESVPTTQGHSQNRVVARAQVGQHIWCYAMCGKLACRSMLFQGVLGACPLRKILEFRTSEMASAGFSGQVGVSKIIYISSIQEALSLLFSSQESPCQCLMYPIHASFDRVLTLSCATNLKLRQPNVRAQAKVAQARAQVCRGLATPLQLCPEAATYWVGRQFTHSEEGWRQSSRWQSLGRITQHRVQPGKGPMAGQFAWFTIPFPAENSCSLAPGNSGQNRDSNYECPEKLPFITAILNNQDPNSLCFKQEEKMHVYLTECLEKKHNKAPAQTYYIPRHHPLTRRYGLVNFLGQRTLCNSITQQCSKNFADNPLKKVWMLKLS